MRKIFHIIVVFLLPVFWASSASAVPQLLVDMSSGQILFQQDAGKKWHPASLTKLMTAYVTFEAIESGQLALDSVVTLSPFAKKAPPSRSSFPVESALTLNDALYMLLVKSANDVAIAVAETVSGTQARFVVEMNEAARRLGMSASHFANANGLHDDSQYSSARDMAVLVLNLRGRFPQYNKIYATRTILAGPAQTKQASYNVMLTKFAGATGMKTGYVCASGYNMIATANRGGRQLLSVVLGAGNGRERGQLSGYLLTQGYTGGLSGLGLTVGQFANDMVTPPKNMRPYICGNQREAYLAERAKLFSGGLQGGANYLADQVSPKRYAVRALGRFLNVGLPRARPDYAYVPKITLPVTALGDGLALPRERPVQGDIPLPRLRPSYL